jgi:hypothetical protein
LSGTHRGLRFSPQTAASAPVVRHKKLSLSCLQIVRDPRGGWPSSDDSYRAVRLTEAGSL